MPTAAFLIVFYFLLLLCPTASAQEGINPEGLGGQIAWRPYSPYADRAYPAQVYFGDTHVHTGLSADAGGGGTRLMPSDSYRFARGEQVMSNTGQPVKLEARATLRLPHDHGSLRWHGRHHRYHRWRAEHSG